MSTRGVSSIIVVIAVVIAIAAAALGGYYLKTRGGGGGGFPAAAVTVGTSGDNIELIVQSGSIPAGEWAYSISTTMFTYTWKMGIVALNAPTVILENNVSPGIYFVSVRHNATGYTYLSDVLVTIPQLPPSVMLTVSANSNPDNTITLAIRHTGGDNLNISDLLVAGLTSDNTTMSAATISPSSGTLTVGGTITAIYAYGANPTNKVIRVTILHLPSRSWILRSESILVQ